MALRCFFAIPSYSIGSSTRRRLPGRLLSLAHHFGEQCYYDIAIASCVLHLMYITLAVSAPATASISAPGVPLAQMQLRLPLGLNHFH
jgi:hypothetical protein